MHPCQVFLLLASLAVCVTRSFQAQSPADRENALRLYQQLSETRRGLTALKRVIDDVDGDLHSQMKRSCMVGGGLSQHCTAQLVNNKMMWRDWLIGGHGPGKKRSAVAANNSELSRRLSDMARKRSGLQLMKRILNEMDADVVHEQKRACQFNLGGHCATESAASVADQWHYLNSPLSPGRKRRDTRLYQKLVKGQLFQ